MSLQPVYGILEREILNHETALKRARSPAGKKHNVMMARAIRRLLRKVLVYSRINDWEYRAVIRVGQELFRFESYEQWLEKSYEWMALAGHPRDYICIDSAERVCRTKEDYDRARDDYNFPVKVYAYDEMKFGKAKAQNGNL